MSTPIATGKRRRSRRGEGEHLRDEILLSTEQLLIETGSEDDVSIRAVAGRVGVTPPSIYLHFPHKDDLLVTVSERQFAAFSAAMESAVSGATDPLDELRRRGLAYVEYGLSHPESYRIMFMTRRTRADHLRRAMACLSFDALVASIERAMASGHVRRDDASLVAYGLWAAVHGLTSLLLADQQRSPGDQGRLIDHVLEMTISGLAPRNPEA